MYVLYTCRDGIVSQRMFSRAGLKAFTRKREREMKPRLFDYLTVMTETDRRRERERDRQRLTMCIPLTAPAPYSDMKKGLPNDLFHFSSHVPSV